MKKGTFLMINAKNKEGDSDFSKAYSPSEFSQACKQTLYVPGVKAFSDII